LTKLFPARRSTATAADFRVPSDPSIPALPNRTSRVRAVLAEAAIVAVIGGLFALALNALSPRGLTLARDYFPGAIRNASLPPAASNLISAATTGTNTPTPTATELIAARLKAKNLQVVSIDDIRQLLHDPRLQQNSVVIVDARDDAHYQAGHIPGAYLFDHYRAPQYLAAVLPVCLLAEQVIVYCLGGDCEDSEFAAVTLRDAGVSNEKLAVYAGGFTEWSTNGLPVELGARGSGVLREEKK